MGNFITAMLCGSDNWIDKKEVQKVV